MFDLIEIGIFLGLLTLGFVAGTIIERRHYASIRQREKEYRHVLAFPMRFPPDLTTPQDVFLVTGTVVISADYFKSFVAGLRNLVGGRFRSYESLMERARREALLRLKREAVMKGSRLVVCVRFETTTITSGWAPSIEVLAFGTALIPRRSGANATPTAPSVAPADGGAALRT